MNTKTRPKARDGTKIRGFFRVHIVNDDGTVAGDSGWKENQITNLGFNQYLVSALGAIAGSKQVSHLNVGTGGAPAWAGMCSNPSALPTIGPRNNSSSSTGKSCVIVNASAAGTTSTANIMTARKTVR